MEPYLKRTGKPAEGVNFTGKFLAMDDQGPLLLHLGPDKTEFLPVFNTEEELKEVLASGKIPFTRVVQITDGAEFYSSLPLTRGDEKLEVAVNLRITGWIDGLPLFRFVQVIREDA